MKRNYNTNTGIAALAIALTCSSTIAYAQSAMPSAKSKAAQPSPIRFSKAAETWAQILADRKQLATVIRTNKLADAHDLAYSIRDGVVTLPFKSDGLTAAKKASLARLVQTVAAIAPLIDKYGDAGNLPKTKAEFAKLNVALNGIEVIYPPHTLPTDGARKMSAAEHDLFLTPGGLYTNADIAANGNTSVYQKYAGYVAAHSTQIKAGDPVCPISETLPDPNLQWIVGGKTYTFCCPPCVAEFVKKAKTDPKSIKTPEAYLKK